MAAVAGGGPGEVAGGRLGEGPAGGLFGVVVVAAGGFEGAFANMYVELGKQFSGGVILL